MLEVAKKGIDAAIEDLRTQAKKLVGVNDALARRLLSEVEQFAARQQALTQLAKQIEAATAKASTPDRTS